jgi:CheY-like chemotaxis protein
MIVREGLRKLLEAERDMDVVGEAAARCQAVAMTRELRPVVVVMDIAMPLLNGLEATRQTRQAVPAAKVPILSAHGDGALLRTRAGRLPTGSARRLLLEHGVRTWGHGKAGVGIARPGYRHDWQVSFKGSRAVSGCFQLPFSGSAGPQYAADRSWLDG